jgi:lipid II:glycine glycyltransferase (peptidoglycan interpeptide bridge formation enzyme)
MKKSFREISFDEFKEFAEACPTKSYMQSPQMFERYQKTGRECYLLGAFLDEELVVAGIASNIYERYGHKIFTFSRGPLADFSKHEKELYYFLDETKKNLKPKHGIVLQISPSLLAPNAPKDFATKLKSHGFKYLGEYEQVKWTYAIDFSKIENLPPVEPPKQKSPTLSPEISPESEQILTRSFRRDHRYTIKYATERYGIKLRELQPSEYNILLKLLEESGRQHGFIPRDQKFFEQMADAFGSEVSAVVAELPDGTPIAAAFFILYGDEVIYLSSGLSREHKKLGGPHLIQSAMIKYAYANGFKKYNFWGTNPDPENGVYKFKQGFHGEVEEFVGTFAAPISPLGTIYLKKLRAAEHRDLT